MNYEAAKLGKTTFDFNPENKTPEVQEQREKYLKTLQGSIFHKRVFGRMAGKKELIMKKIMGEDLEVSLDLFISNMSPYIGTPMAKYYTLLLEKFLSLKDKKFSKNDIVDSLLLKYTNNFTLLTFDTNLRDSLMVISSETYKANMELLANCKK
jgi:hypothetical protein